MTIVYSEDFEGTPVGSLPSGWSNAFGTIAVTTSDVVSGSRSVASASLSGGLAAALYTGVGTLVDMEVRYDIEAQSGSVNPILRADSSFDNGYLLVPTSNSLNSWNVLKRVSGNFSTIGAITGYSGSVAPGGKFSYRARIQGATIYFRVWLFGTAEPTTWNGNVSDSTFSAAGYSGLFAGNDASTADNFVLDNLIASAATDFSLTPSSQGTTPGVATGDYTVAPNGLPSTSTTVSLSDGGAGGTFSPASLTLTTAGAETFTYTPASTGTGTRTLTATASGGFSASHTATAIVSTGPQTVAVTNAALFRSPGNWDLLSPGDLGVSVATLQATAAGAYLKFTVAGTANLALAIDNATTSGLPSGSMPTLRVSIDNGAFVDTQLAPSQTSLTLSTTLSGAAHAVEVYFKSNDLTAGDAWGSSGVSPTNVLRVTGIVIDAGGTFQASALRPKRGLLFGDSIEMGRAVNTNGTDDATQAFGPIIAQALGMEYGQLGYGGQGWEITGSGNIPPFKTAWQYFSAGRARGFSGLDYVIVNHGTNDGRGSGQPGSTIQADALAFLSAIRTACGSGAIILLLVPPCGVYAANLAAAVTASGDAKAFCIDHTSLFPSGLFTLSFGGITEWTYDGVHPLVFGQARLAAAYAAKALAALNQGGAPAITASTPSHQLKRAR